LNPVAACIWKSLDRATGIQELVDQVVEAFDVDVPTAQQDVGRFLDELEARKLIEQVVK
jgi:hypothetical protein